MAKIFLDTNLVIDIAERKPHVRDAIRGQEVFVSPLSFHILCYIKKIKVPNKQVQELASEFQFVPLTDDIVTSSLNGPTSDLEDNIQLHSAAQAECGYLLTRDKRMLDMIFFGKTRIVASWPTSDSM